jgi:hypothetical protein
MNPNNLFDLVGQRFGKLTALRFVGKDKHKVGWWLCLCDCGQERIIRRGSLITGHSCDLACEAENAY